MGTMTTKTYDIELDGVLWVHYTCPACGLIVEYEKDSKTCNFCSNCGREITLEYGTDDN